MRLLLDTHILLWWLGNGPPLSPGAAATIADPDNAIFVSAVTHWEIRLKQSIAKLHVPANFDTRLAAEGFEELKLTAAHTKRVATLPWHHRDPFDRMLVAQADAENLTLLTGDKALQAYGDFVRLVR